MDADSYQGLLLDRVFISDDKSISFSFDPLVSNLGMGHLLAAMILKENLIKSQKTGLGVFFRCLDAFCLPLCLQAGPSMSVSETFSMKEMPQHPELPFSHVLFYPP